MNFMITFTKEKRQINRTKEQKSKISPAAGMKPRTDSGGAAKFQKLVHSIVGGAAMFIKKSGLELTKLNKV